jgi:chromosome segregation ATPase
MSYPSMYKLFRKLETKSPKIEQNEDLTSRDHDDRPRTLQNMVLRPKSAKNLEKRVIAKKKNGRPISAKKNLVNIASKLSIKPSQDAYLLSRLKPTLIAIDKERLYEDNMALKLALNGLQSENVKIKTRITQLEKEVSKKDDIIEELSANEKSPGHKYIHLVNNLKQTIKEGKIEIKAKDEEILKLKRNIKSSKNMELEIQIQSYEEECKRLSVNLAEALNKQSNHFSNSEYDKKFAGELVNSLKKENSDLKIALARAQDELRRFQQEKVQDNEKKKKNGGHQVVNLKLEIQKLKTHIETKDRETREKETLILDELNVERKKSEELRNRIENEEKKNKELQKQIEILKNSFKAKESERNLSVPDLPQGKFKFLLKFAIY